MKQFCRQTLETAKGVSEVCSLVEEYAKDKVEDIAIATHLTEEEINKLREKNQLSIC